MTPLENVLSALRKSPLVVSVQASPETSLGAVEHLRALAAASDAVAPGLLRLEGVASVEAIGRGRSTPTIGLIKRAVPGREVYITPTRAEVDALIAAGCEVIALDGTQRSRPKNCSLVELIEAIHRAGRVAMADCDGIESARYAVRCGADLVGTTLSGYTAESSSRSRGPDLEFLRAAVAELGVPIIAEGRYAEPWQVHTALTIGAAGVVVGGAINDPFKQTKAFRRAALPAAERVFGVDIGGTWMRAATYDAAGRTSDIERIPLPHARRDRMEWIRELAGRADVSRIGISTGGVVDPTTATVTEAKSIIPDYVGTNFRVELEGWDVVALNDGLATAWAHACHPQFAGRRVATLALGTGVGCGWVDRGRIMIGPGGNYPRLNDLPVVDGATFEDLLGGAALSPNPTAEQRAQANRAARIALELIEKLWQPEATVVCGGVGLAPWLEVDEPRSPYGDEAGLCGAAAIALWPLGME